MGKLQSHKSTVLDTVFQVSIDESEYYPKGVISAEGKYVWKRDCKSMTGWESMVLEIWLYESPEENLLVGMLTEHARGGTVQSEYLLISSDGLLIKQVISEDYNLSQTQAMDLILR